MKRVLAIVTALAMLVSLMTVAASAAYSDGPYSFTSTNTAENSGNQHVDPRPDNQLEKAGVAAIAGSKDEKVGEATVEVKLKTGGAGDITHVYAVTYSATELNFSYGDGSSVIWNPETLQYETTDPGGDWTSAEQTITVTNYSDLPVKVEATVQDKSDAGVTIAPTATLALDSAAPAGGGTAGTGEAKSGTITVTLSGTPVGSYAGSYTKIGTILLKVTNNVT